MTYTVGELARVARVSVRALHHYDEIGLVRPSARSEAGYRLYDSRDLERLQQVLFFRELGFKLVEIAAILDDRGFDRRKALVAQRALLAERAEHARVLVDLADKALMALEEGTAMKPEEMFDGFRPDDHEEEARARWGNTEAYAESKRRTSRYGEADWRAMRAEAEAVTIALAAAMAEGVAPTDPRAMDLAEQHRRHIDRWFYDCTSQIHVALGDMYVADARFAANYEKHGEGLTAYLRAAIHANARRAAAPP